MTHACIDIGSNTTRLLVAEPADGGLRPVLQQRAFTHLGRTVLQEGAVSAAKLEEVAEGVAAQVHAARDAGVADPRVVATAALRGAANRDELVAAIHDRAGVEVAVLDEAEEARLAFLGATRLLSAPVAGDVAVVDVGGGSCEVAVGRIADGVRWSASWRMGSGSLADAHLRSDPPTAAELEAVRRHVDRELGDARFEPTELALAVGGSAASLPRLVGAELGPATLAAGVRVLAGAPVAEVARRFDLAPERVRLLPAGILLLQAIAERLGQPLQVGRGGLREGVILEAVAARGG